MRIRRMGKIIMALVLVSTLVATVACTPAETEMLQGVLKNVDSVNGKITIVTKDGKTVTVKISTETEVETDGDNASLEGLAPGAPVDIEVKKEDGAARHIKARQAEVEGTIIKVVSGNVTIETEKGRQVTIQTTNQTRIELDNDRTGTLADLQVGVKVEAKFDSSTRLAFKIEVKEDDEDEDQETSKIGWGILEIRVTDPGPADVKSAVVFLSNIEVHMAGSSNVSDNTSWIPIIGAPPSFDLMAVIGVEKILGSANLTAGKYTQIRMSVTNVTGVTTDNVSYTAEVPGDKLKIVGTFNVGGGRTTVLTLDFDGEKSLIVTGNGKAIFKPVVKLLVNNKGQSGENEQDEEKGNSGNSSGKKD